MMTDNKYTIQKAMTLTKDMTWEEQYQILCNGRIIGANATRQEAETYIASERNKEGRKSAQRNSPLHRRSTLRGTTFDRETDDEIAIHGGRY